MGFVALSTMPVLMAVVIENSGASPAAATGILMMVGLSVRGLIIQVVGAMGDVFGLSIAFLACAGLFHAGLAVRPASAPRRDSRQAWVDGLEHLPPNEGLQGFRLGNRGQPLLVGDSSDGSCDDQGGFSNRRQRREDPPHLQIFVGHGPGRVPRRRTSRQ